MKKGTPDAIIVGMKKTLYLQRLFINNETMRDFGSYRFATPQFADTKQIMLLL